MGLSVFLCGTGRKLFVRSELWGLQWSEHGKPGKLTAARRSEGSRSASPLRLCGLVLLPDCPLLWSLASGIPERGVATGWMSSARPGLPQLLVCSIFFSSSWCLAPACIGSPIIIYEYI